MIFWWSASILLGSILANIVCPSQWFTWITGISGAVLFGSAFLWQPKPHQPKGDSVVKGTPSANKVKK